ncbi:MAG: DHH family phosphoesterase [Oscillospiraceae bacterium]|jgi:phosphoglycolate phosphatase|nr:DHH family phosphoesterase [Oscillospiraceae bacterium]
MLLRDLTKYRKIIIQCHDVPDADAIASGFALQRFFRAAGAEPLLCYGGPAKIQKPSLIMMLELLRIEISHIDELPPGTELLITVDCQRGAGNVKNFALPDGAAVVVIDHHRPEIAESENTVIRPHLASCSTLVWDMLKSEGFPMDKSVQNALFYGLFTDTNGLSELRHPLDRDLAECEADAAVLRTLKNSAITAEELDIIGETLQNREMIGSVGFFCAEPCDANLLGFTSDIAQQVVHIDCCVVCCEQPHGLKLSIRSSAREIMASEIAEFLCRDAGSGGGGVEKAGGFMSYKAIAEISGGAEPKEYLKSRIRAYMDNYDLIYAGNNEPDFGAMPLYKKLPQPVGFARSADVFTAGTKITVRTLEGDVDTVTDEAVYLMVGIRGEVYPILRETFERSYRVLDEPYVNNTEYPPVILNRINGERREILPVSKTCLPKEVKLVRAARIQKDTKVFTDWDTEKYFKGSAGDYIVANEGYFSDCYIVRGDIFDESYLAVQ